MMPDYVVDEHDIASAAKRITGHIHRTPVATCRSLDEAAGRSLFFKCEHLQRVGAFKFRGAINAVLSLDAKAAQRGVATHSSGNHAQALAYAARQRSVSATIIMPANASRVKRDAVEAFGARVIECKPTLLAREAAADEVIAQTGATLIHPYNNAQVIAGQGTVALELSEQMSGLDAICAPVGGGGLISGICIAARAINPDLRIFAAEPAGADDAQRSIAAGRLLPQTNPQTVADGLRTGLGSLTWPIIRDRVERVITVDEAAIVAAMRLAWQRGKFLIEASAAVAVAAVLSDEFRQLENIDRVGVVLTGGNVDLDHLPW